jgi:hypothetical protein
MRSEAGFSHTGPLTEFVRDCLRRRFGSELPGGCFAPIADWRVSAHGIEAPMRCSVAEFLRVPDSFAIIRTVTEVVSGTFEALTAVFTETDCSKMFDILRRTERGPLSAADREFICDTPRIRPGAEIRKMFRTNGWRMDLCDTLMPLVRARCEPAAAKTGPVWRKGFGFALVFTGPSRGGAGNMRILPVAHLGSTGVVETHYQVTLERVRQEAPMAVLQRKGLEYAALGSELQSGFGDGFAKADPTGVTDVPITGGRTQPMHRTPGSDEATNLKG